MSTTIPRAHVMLPVTCSQCRGAVLLECEGVPIYPGYETYNEYSCPYCRKQEIQRTPGAIFAVTKRSSTAA